MSHNKNHGNRLRPEKEAYENKKQQSKNRYAAAQLKINPFWLHNKVLRELKNLFGLDTEIPKLEFDKKGFVPNNPKSIRTINGRQVLCYDTLGIYYLQNKNLSICKCQ